MESAIPLAHWAFKAAREFGHLELLIQASASAALAHLTDGNREDAKRVLREVEQVPHVRDVSAYGDFLPSMVRAAVASGDHGLAERLTSGVDPRSPLEKHSLVAARAVLAESGGETEQAADLYAEAAERWKKWGHVPSTRSRSWEEATAWSPWGGQPRQLSPFERPGRSSLRLGAKPALADTDQLLEQVTALTS